MITVIKEQANFDLKNKEELLKIENEHKRIL